MHTSFLWVLLITILSLFLTLPPSANAQTGCSGAKVSFGMSKKLIPIKAYPASGRPGRCITPKYIIIHTTAGIDSSADAVYEYFAGGAGGRGVASQFAIGKDGKGVQMVESFDKKIEMAYHIANYNGAAIGIELTDNNVYKSKDDAPKAQYQAALKLVRSLMQQYNIPATQIKYGASWKSASDKKANVPAGIYAHYQLNPSNRTDPGAGFFKDFLADLGSGGFGGPNQTATSNCVITEVGNPAGEPQLPPQCQNAGISSDFAKAAADSVAAYKTCKKGNTGPGGDACLRNSLKKSGYSDGSITNFLNKRYYSKRYGCVECSPFVQMVLALFSNSANVDTGNGGDFASRAQINAGKISFKKLPSGTKPQQGDIGSSTKGGYGHILIVKEVKGNVKFTAFESNWDRCTTTDNNPHVTSDYVFFRKQ